MTATAQPGSGCCLNCGVPLAGEYCGHCGQRNQDTRASLWHLATEIASEAFEFDSRIRRTLFPFFFKPGLLTKEYNAGRRMRYSSPLRVYLFASFAFFLVFSLTPDLVEVDLPSARSAGAEAGSSGSGARAVDKSADGMLKELDRFGPRGVRLREQLENFRSADPAAAKQAAARLQSEFTNVLPKLMVVLLPMFALVLKVLYLRSGRFYVEHVIFMLHLQAFGFLVSIPALATHSSVLGGAAGIWALAYGLFAMRRVYAQSWGMTVLKFVLLQASVPLLQLIGVLGAGLAGFILV
ncbi:MAG TPA: DUF3667 domain-containing protein [Myxococcaceae bacterium]|nr:DUF3667 domain-containing protein [Myxococcaceae bacterium]